MFTSVEIHNETGGPPHMSIRNALFIPNVGETISTPKGEFVVKSRTFTYTEKPEGEHHAVMLSIAAK